MLDHARRYALRCLRTAGAASAVLFATHQVTEGGMSMNVTAELEPAKGMKKLKESDLDLRFVQVVFRHGARAPLTESFGAHDVKWQYCGRAYEPVPVDIKGLEGTSRPKSRSDERQRKVVFDGGCRMGQLTANGQLQALQLGDWLRNKYALERGFLPPEYKSNAIKVRSTNISRTLDTVTGVLTGLFPDSEDPILVETCEDTKEWLYPNHRNCKRLQQLMASKKKTLQSKKENSEYLSELERKLRKALEISDKEEEVRFVAMYDVCKTVKFHSNKQHYNMNDELLKELEHVAVEVMKAFVAPEDSEELLSLSIGKVLEDLFMGMQLAASGKSGLAKMQLFSGHDTTLMPILVALGYDLKDWPPFMSNLIFELYWSESLQKHFVRIMYNKEVLRLKGDNGEGFIELPKLFSLLQPFMSVDYNSRCNQVSSATSKPALSGVSNGVD